MFNFEDVKVAVGCCVEKGNFIYLNENGVLFFNNSAVFRVDVNKKDYSLCSLLNYVVIDNRFGKVIILDLSNGQIVLENSLNECEMYTGNFVRLYSSTAIRLRKDLNGASHEYAYDLVDNSYTSLQSAFSVADDKSYFERKRNASKLFAVFGYGKNDHTMLWEYSDFHEYESGPLREKKVESVAEIFGVAESLLWVQLNGGRIVGLCPDTGGCVKNVDHSSFDATDYEQKGLAFSGPKTWGTMFVPDESKIVLLPYGEYAEIDLKSERPVMVCYATKQSFKDAGIDCSGRMIAHGNMIYFCEGMSTKVGAFDRDKKELVWYDNLKNYHAKAGMPAKIMATDSHLYFQDNNNNLFVFEKV